MGKFRQFICALLLVSMLLGVCPVWTQAAEHSHEECPDVTDVAQIVPDEEEKQPGKEDETQRPPEEFRELTEDAALQSQSIETTASNIVINGVDIGYAHNSYFTKNGSSCANSYWSNGRCHHNGVCTSATHSQCNCMRYWPTGNPNTCQVDLLGSQCLAFARYCQWKVYGSFATGTSSYYSNITGAISKSNCTASNLKSKLLGCAPATHIRMPSPHSVCVVSTSDSGITIADANSDGYCKVRLITYSWENFASYVQGKGGIDYAYARVGVSGGVTSCTCSTSYAGQYICTTSSANLNIRSGHGSGYSVIGAIPSGATVTVSKASGTSASDWAHVTYGGITGYASMQYLQKVQTSVETSPAIHWWIAETAYGDSPDPNSLKAGNRYYLCYRVYDKISGKDWDEVASDDYTVSLAFYAPDGSKVYSSSFTDDQSWISVFFAEPGKYTREVIVTGDLTGSFSGSFTINENPKQIFASTNSLSLTLGGTDSTTIYVWTEGYYNGGTSVAWSRSNSNISCSWGTQLDDGRHPLTITANGQGTTTVTLSSKVTDTGEILDSMTLTVTVTAKTYTVSYNANGGSGAPGSQTKTHGTDLTLSTTTPTRFGYSFLGWATNSSATSPNYYSGDTYSANSGTTLYAVWGTPNEISGNYAGFTRAATVNNGGAGVYYKFTPYTSTYYRIYGVDEADTRVYLYDASGNQLGADDDSGDGNQFQLDYNFTAGNTYYIYVRYYSSSQTGTLDYKVAYGYRINYNANGGSGAPPTTYKYYNFDVNLSTTVPTKPGSTFLGWARSNTATTAEYQPGDTFTENTNITLYAVWKTDNCTLRYDANGGSGAPGDQVITPGSSATVSATVPTRFGYTFLGWAKSSSATSATYLPGASITVSADTTLYAVWQSASTISSGVTSSSYSTTISFADGCKYYVFTPSFSGKVRFESTGSLDTKVYLYNASGSQLDYDDDDGDSNNFQLTYAVTSGTKYYVMVRAYGNKTGTINFTVKRAYDVTYNANGGSGAPASQIKLYGETLTISTGTPSYSGKTFKGWATSSGGSVSYQPGGSYTGNGNLTLYAVWGTSCDSGHSYSYSVTKNPTTSATGTLTGTCSKCSGTTTVTLPKLNTTDYSHSITKAATCTATGTARYTWKTTTYGSYSFNLTIRKLGHDMINGICNRCGARDSGWGSVTKKLVKMVFTRSADMVEDYYFEYNTDGRVSKIGTATIRYDEEGRCLSSAGGYDTYTYDENGNMSSCSRRLSEGIMSKTTYYYDSNGFLSKSVRETGNTAWTEIFSTETTFYVCNAQGEVVEESSEDSTTYHSYTYDALGRISSETADVYTEGSSSPTRIVREYDYNNYKPFVAVLTWSGQYGPYIDLKFYDSMGTPVWDVLAPMGTAGTEISPETDQDGYVVYADEIYDSFTWEFFYEDASSSAKTVATGWSGYTQWTLTDDGVLRVYGSGSMKNYGYSDTKPWDKYNSQITSVVIEKGVTAVGECAFKGLTKLQSVTLPSSGLSKIGEAAFYGCTALKSITIPEGVYTIWSYTFKNCTALTQIRMPSTLIKIDQGAFENCTAMSYISFPTNLEILGSWSFKGCTGLREADISWADITEIREGAFKNCSALSVVQFPTSIRKLGDSCFYGIGAESITIPSTVTQVGPWCFARASLKTITFEGNAPTIGQGAFNKITLTAYYPKNNSTWTASVRLNYGGNVTWRTK